MRKRLKIYGLVVLSLVAAGALIRYGHAELSAFAWHVQHGFHADLGGIRIRVPLAYEASDPAGLPSMSLMRLPGLLWHEGGIIDVEFQRLPSPEQMEALDARFAQKGKELGNNRTRVGERTTSFAGKQGKCVEYDTRAVLPSRLNGYEIRGFEIQCRFGSDVSVWFMGSPKLKDEFYNIIQTAQPVEARN